MKTYYFPINPDTAFGNSDPVCVDKKEAERLMREWYGPYSADPRDDIEFNDIWREATDDEIAEYGTYDT